ncbi:hypothetical protein [Rhodoglobus aureus]|uniref:Tetratricopeptide repeat protein n=1 Tax=Rhodoglobus aureus TaxID=191497 RepID=A0ABP4G2Z1_9MICO
MTSLSSAQAALDAGSWQVARTAFLAVAEETADPLAYEGLAQAAWWLDEGATCVGSRETAYRRHRELGDSLGAARAATSLAWDSLLFGHGEAVALGWWTRAESLLEVVGMALQGVAMTSVGNVEGGMAKLDASVAAATSGDVVDPMWMGKVCCWLIIVCNRNRDVTRAADWCRRVEAICAERNLAPLFNVCRIQYASVQVARGSWSEAERELTGVIERLSGSQRTSRLEAVVQLGELRRRQGRLDEAESLFTQAEFHPVAISRLARIHLAGGDSASAWTAIRGLLDRLPQNSRVVRADVLYLAVVASQAAGEVEEAQLLADELRLTAELTRTDSLMASALTKPTLGFPLRRSFSRRVTGLQPSITSRSQQMS